MRSCVHASMLFKFSEKWWIVSRLIIKNKLGDRMIKLLLNSVFAKDRDLPVSRLRLWQLIYLLATDKSLYFAQPPPIIVN